MKKNKNIKQTMVFSETAQPSISYYDPVTVCSLSQWTTSTGNINWALNWPCPNDSLGRGNTDLKFGKKLTKFTAQKEWLENPIKSIRAH